MAKNILGLLWPIYFLYAVLRSMIIPRHDGDVLVAFGFLAFAIITMIAVAQNLHLTIRGVIFVIIWLLEGFLNNMDIQQDSTKAMLLFASEAMALGIMIGVWF